MAAQNVALVAGWLLLFAPIIRWVARTLTREELRLNLALALAAFVALALRGRRIQVGAILFRPARWTPLPLGLALASVALFLVAEYRLNIQIFGATAFGLGTWALFGLYVEPARWRRALPVVLLLVALLPFNHLADQYAGFAARVASAQLAAGVLRAFDLSVISAETIIVLENGVAHVDIPCAGVKSLWSGALFFLGATILLRRRLELRWALAAAIFTALLLAVNVGRVTIITLLAVALELPEVAAVVHEPLGIFGFVAVCAAGYGMLVLPHSSPEGTARADAAPPLALLRSSPEGTARADAVPWFTTGVFERFSTAGRHAVAERRGPALPLAITLSALALVPFTPRQSAAAPVAFTIDLPANLNARPAPLTEVERSFFADYGASAAVKQTFELDDLRGALLTVDSTSWQAHHPPELCLAGAGLRIDDIAWAEPVPGLRLRVVSLEGRTRTAIYWFQSGASTTDSILGRIGVELAGGDRRFVLVSMLVDRELAPGSSVLAELARTVHRAVDQGLRPGPIARASLGGSK